MRTSELRFPLHSPFAVFLLFSFSTFYFDDFAEFVCSEISCNPVIMPEGEWETGRETRIMYMKMLHLHFQNIYFWNMQQITTENAHICEEARPGLSRQSPEVLQHLQG